MTAGLHEHCDFCLRPRTLITSQNPCLHQRLIYGHSCLPSFATTTYPACVRCVCPFQTWFHICHCHRHPLLLTSSGQSWKSLAWQPRCPAFGLLPTHPAPRPAAVTATTIQLSGSPRSSCWLHIQWLMPLSPP